MPDASAIQQRGADVLLSIRVQPKASRNAIRVEPGGLIRVSVTQPPSDGAANRAVVEYLSKILGVSTRRVSLRSGDKSRNKTIVIGECDAGVIRERLASLSSNAK